MNRARMKRLAISSMPVALLVLALDLSKPGWGTFSNPVFYARWGWSAVMGLSDDQQAVGLDDVRLKGCEAVLQPSALDNSQTALRKTLTGESESVAISQLGAPACKLADDSYRWLTEGGLSLDLNFDEWGNVADAKLNRN